MPKVLLVEDSKLIRIMTERALAKAGHQVMVAIDGEAALNIAVESHPDVILLVKEESSNGADSGDCPYQSF